MDAALHQCISIATLACSLAALFFSLLAAFPGLKDVLAAIRDGVLWFALFLVLGGIGFVVWQHFHRSPASFSGNHAAYTIGRSMP
jgi:hypothetical protein